MIEIDTKFILPYFMLIILFIVFLIFANWLILPIAGIVWFLIEYKKNGNKGLKLFFIMGIFLAVFDWIIENFGAIYGYWVSNNSNFYILAVPFEVTVCALFGGTAFSMFISKLGINKNLTLKISLIFATGGVFGEYMLNARNLMKYGNGWTSLHAFFAYFCTFLLFFWLNKKLCKYIK